MQGDEVVPSKLSAVKDRLDETGIRWAVFAGAAAYCYGSKRKVTDIDILVKGVDWEKTKSVLKEIESVDVVADLKINVYGETCLFFMDDEMEEKIQRRKLFDVEIPVIPVEDNVIFKTILQRTENKGKHDIKDIRRMIKNEKIDLEYSKREFENTMLKRELSLC